MDKSIYNALKNNGTNLLLEINNAVHYFDDVEFLQEDNPYPADCRYKILINYPPLNKVFKNFLQGIRTDLCSDNVSNIFFEIKRLNFFTKMINSNLNNKKTNLNPKIKYFLNNVEYLKIDEKKIIIKGVCSTLIPNFHKPAYYKYIPPK